jgi:D-mannonate dehydratase
MHQVMVTKVLSQVYPQAEVYEGKVKAAAIVRIDGVHTTQGSDQVTPGYLISDELNQAIRTINRQVDTDDGYFVVKRA